MLDVSKVPFTRQQFNWGPSLNFSTVVKYSNIRNPNPTRVKLRWKITTSGIRDTSAYAPIPGFILMLKASRIMHLHLISYHRAETTVPIFRKRPYRIHVLKEKCQNPNDGRIIVMDCFFFFFF